MATEIKTKWLKKIDAVIAQGPFDASWDSLEHYTEPIWYKDAKFGIFIHWGVYSVPAFGNEWYPRNMYVEGTREFEHHRKTYGDHKVFGYKDFIPMFTAERFDPAEWAAVFEESGARFVMPVAEHHDGFQMYDSALSRWNAAQMGPCRDIVGELAAEVRKKGMVFAASSHRAEHWWFMGDGRLFDSDVNDPAYEDFYGPAKPFTRFENYFASSPDQAYLEDWLIRTCEIIDKYRPQVLWFDWWIMNMAFKPCLKKLAAFYYNRGKEWGVEVAINHKNDAFPTGTAIFDVERGQLSGTRMLFWQTDTALAKNSWGYTENNSYKETDDVICDLVDIVSKNGALLLNVGPRPDGTIPDEEIRMLRTIGAWLKKNGEAIYGTRPWFIYGEGPTTVKEGAFTDTERAKFTPEDIRYTTKDGTVYAIVMRWPENGRVKLKSFAARLEGKQPHLRMPAAVSVLGSSGAVTYGVEEDGLLIEAKAVESGIYPIVIKIAMV